MSKSWQTQVKRMEIALLAKGIQPGTKQPTKRLLEEKEKTIQSLKKKLKIPIADHPQTKELLSLKREKDFFQEYILNLNENILYVEQEK